MISKIILPHSFKVNYDCDYLVGVDYGAYQLAKQGVMMDVSIGDFDSVDQEQFKLIKAFSKEVIQLNVDKNETDSEAALMHVSSLKLYDIILISDLGHRFDHLLNNFRLLSKYDFKFVSEHNEVFLLKEGLHKIKKSHQYLSLFANDEVTVTLRKTLYELTMRNFDESDTYLTSNEIINDEAELEVVSGSVFVVMSDDN